MEDLTSTIVNEGIASYMAIAFILYGIRQASNISNRFIPLAAALLGVGTSMLQHGGFGYDVLIQGIGTGLLAVGSVAVIKYQLEKKGEN